MEMTLAQLMRNMDYLEEKLGETFKKARQNRGLTQSQVAAAMDVSWSTIERFEDGNITLLSTWDILVLAEFLGITPAIHPEIDGYRAANMLDDLSTGDRFVISREADAQEDYDPDLPCNKKGCSMSFRACCCGCDEMLAYEAKKKGESHEIHQTDR